jgi:hypothetical protein
MELVVFFLPVLIKDVETNFAPIPEIGVRSAKMVKSLKKVRTFLFSAIAFSSTGLDC